MSASAPITLDYAPREWQRECHRTRARFTVLALHRRAGKTELALMELIDKALRCALPLGLFTYIAPLQRQAKAIAWARLKHRLRPLEVAGAVTYNEADLVVAMRHNGATIRLIGADNPDAMRGVRLDGCVIDEVAQIKPEVWQEIVQPALSDRRGWAMFIGTPNGVNLFSELFARAAALPDWKAARYTVYDTQAIDADEVQRLRRDMPEQAFAREYLCDFAAAGDDQLIGLTDAENAARRVYTERDVADAPLIIGIDPARFGGDRSVLIMRRGLQAYTPTVWRGLDNMEVAARCANLIEQHSPDAVFCDAGAGAGVIDRLRQLDYDVVEVPFGGRPMLPEQFVNRRTEMWWLMRDWIMSGGAIPNDVGLKTELSTPVYWFDPAGRKALESKDEIKKRLQGGASPDLADALALTFAYPVRKRTAIETARITRASERDEYDPYAKVRE